MRAKNEREKRTQARQLTRLKMADIPVVSLVGDEEVIGKVDAAFRDVGFVFVVHHSILPHQVRWPMLSSYLKAEILFLTQIRSVPCCLAPLSVCGDTPRAISRSKLALE